MEQYPHSISRSMEPTPALDRHRLANAVRAYRGYSRNKRGIATAQSAWPMSLSVEPTTSCNLRCPECPSGLRSFTRPTGMLEVDTLKRVLNEIGQHRCT